MRRRGGVQVGSLVLGLGGAVFGVVAACSSSSSVSSPAGPLSLGQWGGDSAAMIVGDTAMHLHISCTYGDVSGLVQLNASGEFDVAGSYLLRAYPIAIGPTMPARFRGRVEATSATITVTVTDTVQHTTVVRGPVTVQLGRDPKLMPCPICRRQIVTRAPAF